MSLRRFHHLLCSRLAHLLAGSFNFQGKVKKIFYVLSDDKIGSGARLKPGILAQKPAVDETPMETDVVVVEQSSSTPQQGTSTGSARTIPLQTLSQKLAAKRKSDSESYASAAKQKTKQ
jgi:hypothetical protein